MIFTGFQSNKYVNQELDRYQKLAVSAHSVYVFAGPAITGLSIQPEPSLTGSNIVKVDLAAEDVLCQEWFLLFLTDYFSVLFCAKERELPAQNEADRAFDTILTFDTTVIEHTLAILGKVLAHYRPDKLEQMRQGCSLFPPVLPQSGYALSLMTAFLRQTATYRPVINQLDQDEAILETVRALLHDSSQPLTALLVLLDLFDQQGYADTKDLQSLKEMASEIKTILTDVRQTTLPVSLKTNIHTQLKNLDGDDVLIG